MIVNAVVENLLSPEKQQTVREHITAGRSSRTFCQGEAIRQNLLLITLQYIQNSSELNEATQNLYCWNGEQNLARYNQETKPSGLFASKYAYLLRLLVRICRCVFTGCFHCHLLLLTTGFLCWRCYCLWRSISNNTLRNQMRTRKTY